MATYRELTGAGVPTRAAAALVGVPRATATRKPRAATLDRGRVMRSSFLRKLACSETDGGPRTLADNHGPGLTGPTRTLEHVAPDAAKRTNRSAAL